MASSTSNAIEEKQVKGKNVGEEWNKRRQEDDNYEWKKYGQKYIKGISKYRSYFKCKNKNCGARKKVEWPTDDTNNIETLHEGEHNHRALVASDLDEARILANKYDLATQMFGSKT